MMKELIKQFIPACFLFIGVFASCTSDGEPDSPAPTSGISLRLPVAETSNTRSSVDTGTDLENQIHNIHLWFFASDASDTDKALLYKWEIPNVYNEVVLNYTDEELRLYNMSSTGSYKLMVIANKPEDATTIGEDTTLGELKNYSYSAAGSGRPMNPFCMIGSTDGAHDFSIESQVDVSLIRVASRLDVKVVNATGQTLQVNRVSIVNDQRSVQLFISESGAGFRASDPFTSESVIHTTSTTADEVKCSGYVYENRSATSTDVVIEGSIAGVPATWTVPIKPDGSTILPRNSICKAIINLKGTSVKVTIGVEVWRDTFFDAEVHPQ